MGQYICFGNEEVIKNHDYYHEYCNIIVAMGTAIINSYNVSMTKSKTEMHTNPYKC